jgi:hypothetical protein
VIRAAIRTPGLVASCFLVLASLSGCASTQLDPAGGLVPAADTEFGPPVSVGVSAGTSGLERTDGSDLWWLTSSDATIDVMNVASSRPSLVLTVTVVPPPCLRPAMIELDPPGAGAVFSATVRGPGRTISLRLNVPRGVSVQVPVKVRNPVCRIPTDTRPFFAGLVNLRADPK